MARSGLPMTPEQRTRLRELRGEIAKTGPPLVGSIEIRRTRCGNPRCACHGEPPRLHGPYVVWTRKVGGKTVTRTLDEEQRAVYEPLFENSRRLRELVGELQELTLSIIEEDSRQRGRQGRQANS